MVTYPACSAGTAVNVAATAANFIALQCDPQGKLYVSLTDPTMRLAKSGAVATATTTVLVVGVASKSIYVYLMAWQSSGTNSANTHQKTKRGGRGSPS